ncbi:hypothetical protein T492DRAFT_831578 [Pavlovales sp. CCMP2436]|nr:hypothetical protein T492DRAFT_831578 [Pavlovales sp. CCMP2436]
MLRARCSRESTRESAHSAALLEQLEQCWVADDELEAKCVKRGVDYEPGPEDEPNDDRLKRMQDLRIKCITVDLDREIAISEWQRRDDPDPQAVAQWEEVDRALALCRAECDEFDHLRYAAGTTRRSADLQKARTSVWTLGTTTARSAASQSIAAPKATARIPWRSGIEVFDAAATASTCAACTTGSPSDANNEWNQMSTLAQTTTLLLVYTIDLYDRLIFHRCWPTGLDDVNEDFRRRFPHDSRKDDYYWDANTCWRKKYSSMFQAARDSDGGLPGYNFTYTMRKPPPYQFPRDRPPISRRAQTHYAGDVDYLVQERGVRMIKR